MKLTELSNEYLSWMIKSYSKNHKRVFGWQQIRELFPTEDEEFILDAFRKLSKDGLVTNVWASNKIYLTELDLNAISDDENNTALVRTYEFLKELRSWI